VEHEDPARYLLKELVRGLAVVGLGFALVYGGLVVYTSNWSPVVAVDSSSMQHSFDASEIGLMDTGDLVLVKTVQSSSDIVTYVKGRVTDYRTYGDYGDVILFRDPEFPDEPPVIHRAMAFVIWNESTRGYDVPGLRAWPSTEWSGMRGDVVATGPYGLTSLTLHHGGFGGDTDLKWNLTFLAQSFPHSGYLTLGDNNVYTAERKTDWWIVPYESVIGVARGELPWLGLPKLLLQPSPWGCCESWGSTDPIRGAPANSWLGLEVSLTFIVVVPLAVGYFWKPLSNFLRRKTRNGARTILRVLRLKQENEGRK